MSAMTDDTTPVTRARRGAAARARRRTVLGAMTLILGTTAGSLAIAIEPASAVGGTPTVTSISPTSGPGAGGTSVAIHGTNLSSAITVDFAGTGATITYDTATEIKATSPGGPAGSVGVSVTTGGGTSATSPLFTYLGPTITSVTPVSGPGNGGNKVVILGTEFNGTSAVHFGSTEATSFSSSSTKIIAVVPLGTGGSVPISVTTPGGSTTWGGGQYSYLPPTISSLTPTSGPGGGGAKVTIHGKDFQGASAVTFAGTEAASYSVNAAGTAITAYSPAETAGAADVEVTTPGGDSSATPATYTFLAPIVTKVSPATGAGNGGTTVTIKGANLTGATAVDFGSEAGAIESVSAKLITVISPAGSGTVYVTVITPGGTSTTSPTTQFTYTGGSTPVDASNYSVACSGVSGSVSFTPGLSSSGPDSGTETYQLSATLSDCTATPTMGGTPVTVHGGVVTGTLTDQLGSSCLSLVNNNQSLELTGDINIDWSTTPSLVSQDSVVAINSAEFSIPTDGTDPLSFQMPSDTQAAVTGSFTAGNGGVDTIARVDSGDTLGELFESCVGGATTTTMPLAGGVFDLGSPPSSITVEGGSGGIGSGYALDGGQLDYNAIGQFGSQQLDLSQVTSWSVSNASIATQATCDESFLTYPPTCFNLSNDGPLSVSATWEGVTGTSAPVTVVTILQLNYIGNLPDAELNSPYDLSLDITGGAEPYMVSATGLPTGLSVDNTTDPPSITGTPEVGGTFEPDITVTDASGQSTGGFYLLSVDCSGFCVTPTQLPGGSSGNYYDQFITASGGTGPYTYTAVYGLPGWATLNPTTGELSGTPTTDANYEMVVEVTDSSSPTPQTLYWLYSFET